MPKACPEEFRRDVIAVARKREANALDRQRWSTREQLRLAIVTWIERT